MAKRTYSRRGGNTTPSARELQRKRSKLEDSEDNELRWPTPRGRQPQANLSASRKSKFGGPVSFQDEDVEMVDAEAPTTKSKGSALSLLDKALQGKLKPIKLNQPNIHGSRDDFVKTMNDPNRVKNNNAGATSKYHLPTPPSDLEGHHAKSFSKFFPNLKGHGSSLLSGSKYGIKPKSAKAVFGPPETSDSESSLEVEKNDAPKEPYVPKQYEVDKTPAPKRDICGNRLSSNSKLANLWSSNQANSLFLRLPLEVRHQIYDLAFNNKTIKIGYQSFSAYSWTTKSIRPVFKYHTTVLDRKTNPFFSDDKLERLNPSHSFTPLLNATCRQLYLETATLPFTTNFIAFESHNIMVNFMLHEKRLSRQQRGAITTLCLPNDVPGSNMLEYLPNLEKVFLAFDQVEKPKGWYRVVRVEGKRPRLNGPGGFLVE